MHRSLFMGDIRRYVLELLLIYIYVYVYVYANVYVYVCVCGVYWLYVGPVHGFKCAVINKNTNTYIYICT